MTRFHRNLISDKHSLCLQRSDAVSIYDGIQAYVKSLFRVLNNLLSRFKTTFF